MVSIFLRFWDIKKYVFELIPLTNLDVDASEKFVTSLNQKITSDPDSFYQCASIVICADTMAVAYDYLILKASVAIGGCFGNTVFLPCTQHIPQACVQGHWDAYTERVQW